MAECVNSLCDGRIRRPARPSNRTTWQCPRMLAVSDHGLTIDENMTHPDSVAPRLRITRSVRDRLRIEDHNVGKVAFFERASRSRFAPASLGCAGAPSIYRIASRAFIVPSLRTSTVARRPVPAHRSATSGRPGSRNHPTRDRVQGPSFHRGRDTSLRAMHKRCAAQPIC